MRRFLPILGLVVLAAAPVEGAAEDGEREPVTSAVCAECHEEAASGGSIAAALARSVHEGLECLDCHRDRGTVPHTGAPGFTVGCQGCRGCHEEESAAYRAHGRREVGTCDDIPSCASCHGGHDVLPVSDPASPVSEANLPGTCARCHEDVDLTSRYEILFGHPVQLFRASVHGTPEGDSGAPRVSCVDCHGTDGSAHRILAPTYPESPIAFANIAATCGRCHDDVAAAYRRGIHGRMVANGEHQAPTCTDCHGEHGILPPDDPRSPVSPTKIAEVTCSRCHEAAPLNERLATDRPVFVSFVDSFHGLKSARGDRRVANCASCHEAHGVLPPDDPRSTVYPANLPRTCGRCHPGMTEELALATPIHGVGGVPRPPLSVLIETIYRILIPLVVGLMLLHVLVDYLAAVRRQLRRRPQVRRMTRGEVLQHAALALSFVVLAVTGLALKFDRNLVVRTLFGFDGGFLVRRWVHRAAAGVFLAVTVWHLVYLLGPRGRRFLRDMLPRAEDLRELRDRVRHNLGLIPDRPRSGRFTYVEKVEYWALVWGTVVMAGSGIVLWFDRLFVQLLPQGAIDVALTLHLYEAILAVLAILVWHLYAVVFSPGAYPMNPAWLTGAMPEDLYAEEHPAHLEEAIAETEPELRREAPR